MKINLYERLTHKYRDGWSGEDDHKYIGEAKVLRYTPVRTRTSDDFEGSKITHTLVVAPAALRDTDLRNSIADTMGGSSCRHEHDCCGCPSTYVDVRRISRREYSVKLTTFYNY